VVSAVPGRAAEEAVAVWTERAAEEEVWIGRAKLEAVWTLPFFERPRAGRHAVAQHGRYAVVLYGPPQPYAAGLFAAQPESLSFRFSPV
jgi:hypothetical protein